MSNPQTLHFAQRTCTTPFVDDGVVRLPMIFPNDLPYVGAKGPTVDFYLNVDCPTNLGYVGYYVVPVHGIEDEAQGVIAINPASTAQGIGVQIMTRYELWLSFDNERHVNNYSPLQFGPTKRYGFGHLGAYPIYGGGLTVDPLSNRKIYRSMIPLKVNVIRTGNVVPGNYTSAIWIHMVYR